MRALRVSRPCPAGDAPHDHLRGDVRDERDHEEDEAEVDERGGLEVRASALVRLRDLAAEGVAGAEEIPMDAEPPPITCVTAIASPIARPRPRMSAAATPDRARTGT